MNTNTQNQKQVKHVRTINSNPITESETTPPVTFTTSEGEVFEIGNLPANLGRATALAGESTLRKIWDAPEEEEACQNMLKEI